MVNVRTTFDPKVDGFKFVNYFQLPSTVDLNIPFFHISSVSLPNLVYGLCGGMCYSALDYFHAGKVIPGDGDIPASGSPIYEYLLGRQLTSLDHGSIEKILLWMLLSDEELEERLVQNEIPILRANLDGGNPAVLILIRARGLSDPSHNHQVTAIGYDFDQNSNTLTVYLYDPNHPGDEPSLTMNLTDPNRGINLTQTTGESLRGFFVSPYQPLTPP